MSGSGKIRLRAVYGIPISKPFMMTYFSPGRPNVDSKVYVIAELSGIPMTNPMTISIKGNNTSDENYYKDLKRVFNNDDVDNKRFLQSEKSSLKTNIQDVKPVSLLKTSSILKSRNIGTCLSNKIAAKPEGIDRRNRDVIVIDMNQVSQQPKCLREKDFHKDLISISKTENNSVLDMQVFEENGDQSSQSVKDESKMNLGNDNDSSLNFEGKEIKVEPKDDDEWKSSNEPNVLHVSHDQDIESNNSVKHVQAKDILDKSLENGIDDSLENGIDKSVENGIDETSKGKMKSFEADCIIKCEKIKKEISSPELNSDCLSKAVNQSKPKTVVYVEKLMKNSTRKYPRRFLSFLRGEKSILQGEKSSVKTNIQDIKPVSLLKNSSILKPRNIGTCLSNRTAAKPEGIDSRKGDVIVNDMNQISQQPKCLREKDFHKGLISNNKSENNSTLDMQVFEENEDQSSQSVKDESKMNLGDDNDSSLNFEGKEIKVEPKDDDEWKSSNEPNVLHVSHDQDIESNNSVKHVQAKDILDKSLENGIDDSLENGIDKSLENGIDKFLENGIDETNKGKMKSFEADCIISANIRKDIFSRELNSDCSSKAINERKPTSVVYVEKLHKNSTRKTPRRFLIKRLGNPNDNITAPEKLIYTTYIPVKGKQEQHKTESQYVKNKDLKTKSDALHEITSKLDDGDGNKDNEAEKNNNLEKNDNCETKDNVGITEKKPRKEIHFESTSKGMKRSYDEDPDDIKSKKKIALSDIHVRYNRLINQTGRNFALPVVFLQKVNQHFTEDKSVRMFIPNKKMPELPDVELLKQVPKRISVSLANHQDKFYIEDQVSLKMMDRGKSDSEKTVKVMVCKECKQFRTEDKQQMEIHIEQHVNGELSCKECKFIAKSLNQMFLHRSRNHNKPIVNHRCYVCKTEFRMLKEYQNHITQKHNLLPWVCNHCSTIEKPVMFEDRPSYKEHFQDSHKDLMLQCSHCGLHFITKANLHRHPCDGKDNKEEKAPCDICGKMFSYPCGLKKHKNAVHFNIRAHPCTQCSYSAKNSAILKHHIMAKHKGVRPFKCDQCSFSCVKSCQLKSHKKTHTGYKPYKCDKCPYKAAWNVMLKDHKKLHVVTSLGKECEICSVVVRAGAPFTKHMRKEHGEEGK